MKKEKYTLNDQMGFGKYRMFALKQMIDFHSDYIKWCLNKVSGFAMDNEAWNYAIAKDIEFSGFRHSFVESNSADEVEILSDFPFKNKKEAREYFERQLYGWVVDAQVVI